MPRLAGTDEGHPRKRVEALGTVKGRCNLPRLLCGLPLIILNAVPVSKVGWAIPRGCICFGIPKREGGVGYRNRAPSPTRWGPKCGRRDATGFGPSVCVFTRVPQEHNVQSPMKIQGSTIRCQIDLQEHASMACRGYHKWSGLYYPIFKPMRG